MTYTAFTGLRRLAAGSLRDVARAVEAAGPADRLLVFEDATGSQIELDLRNGADAAAAGFEARSGNADSLPARRGPGRPKLGVVPREVTLLPRHWDWLAAQPGGASATLRRLVDEARRAGSGAERARETQQALHRVMSTLAGDLPGFEEALRALYAANDDRFDALVGAWPADVREYVGRLAGAERVARVHA